MGKKSITTYLSALSIMIVFLAMFVSTATAIKDTGPADNVRHIEGMQIIKIRNEENQLRIREEEQRRIRERYEEQRRIRERFEELRRIRCYPDERERPDNDNPPALVTLQRAG